MGLYLLWYCKGHQYSPQPACLEPILITISSVITSCCSNKRALVSHWLFLNRRQLISPLKFGSRKRPNNQSFSSELFKTSFDPESSSFPSLHRFQAMRADPGYLIRVSPNQSLHVWETPLPPSSRTVSTGAATTAPSTAAAATGAWCRCCEPLKMHARQKSYIF